MGDSVGFDDGATDADGADDSVGEDDSVGAADDAGADDGAADGAADTEPAADGAAVADAAGADAAPDVDGLAPELHAPARSATHATNAAKRLIDLEVTGSPATCSPPGHRSAVPG
jgi:hypothetical protein